MDNIRTHSNILQWNFNGIKSHLPELQSIKYNISPFIFTIWETNLKPEENSTLRHFQCFRKDVQPDLARGRVATFVKDTISAEEIELNTNLQAVAIRIKAPIELTIEPSESTMDCTWNPEYIESTPRTHHYCWRLECTLTTLGLSIEKYMP
ncbi:hypothetical protein JTB14_025784 [Gonioctena quinquepunctata]|nr:hypothetical protein JTB14_025784 [Gonioctena quinquepunctata]